MGEDQPSPSYARRRKHLRSSDNESDDEPKRRKHHHNRRHHRRHHHHSRHERYRNEEELEEAISMQKRVEHASHMKPVDDEREEGEIFEDEEEGGEGTVLAVEADSEVESGEIKMELEAPLAIKRPSCLEDPVSDNNVGNLNAENDVNILKNCFVKENDRDGCFLFETTEDTSKYIGEYGDLGGCEARKKSKQENKISEKEKHKDIDLNDIRHRERSRSPASRESSYLLKHTDKDDVPTAEKVKSNPKFEQEEDKKGGSVINNGCISPRISKEKNRETVQSSSSSKYCIEVSNRDQSLSDDHTGGRLSNQVRGHDAEESISLILSERQINGRNSSDHERSGGLDKLDRYTGRGREVDKEAHNERDYSVYSRHDGHNSRHSSRDRGTAGVNRRHGSRERGKEVGRSFSGYRDRDNQQIDKGARRDRERNHSSSRYDEREDRHDNRDREWDRGRERDKYSNRDREREREIDRSKDRFSERDRIRNVKGEHERERDGTSRDKSQITDRKTHSLEDRERVDQIERDRSSNHNRYRDSRQSKYNDKERWKERTKSNEFSKYSTCNIHGSEEEKKNYLREEDDDYQGRIEQQLANQDEEDIEKIKEESRKRRQAILEKYKQQQKQQHMEPPPNTHDKEELISNVKDGMQQVHKTIDGVDTTALEELVDQHDPSDAYTVDPSFTVGKSPVLNGLSVPEMTATAGVLGEGSPKSERSTDMFCDDIFGDSPAAIRKSGKDDFVKVDRSGFNDNWDDAEGYYSYRLGELLDGRYEVLAAHGKGVFSTVVRAKDLKPEKGDLEEVAIKIIRSNDTMYKAGMEELVILKKLTGADPEDRRHCVRFLSSFKYRNHLCLVFESLHMNLREVLKKFGRNIGLRLTAVRAYAKQLFIALKHLRNCGILHCDIKPDNMLVNEAKNVLKLCDFGNAMFAGKNEITPYLVSRFYRAPEIILGLPYDHPLDIWSVGCCLFEVYTGKVLFPGPSNNDMLRLQMELKGPFPKKMLRKGAFMDQHFDQDLNFHAAEEDPVSKKTVKRLLLNIKPKDIGTLILGSPGEDPKMLTNFKDLLDRIFVLDPEKRMTVSQALSHPFITGK